MKLETMRPNPAWDPAAFEDAVATLSAHAGDVEVTVWGADWCSDCRAVLPDLAAALDAAGVADESVIQHPVDREKEGPATDEYGVEYVPTVVIERDGEEVARFVERADRPAAVVLADQLDESDSRA